MSVKYLDVRKGSVSSKELEMVVLEYFSSQLHSSCLGSYLLLLPFCSFQSSEGTHSEETRIQQGPCQATFANGSERAYLEGSRVDIFWGRAWPLMATQLLTE